MKLTFSTKAWEQYLYWQTTDKKTLKRINLLIKDIQKVLRKVLVSQNLYRQKRDKSEAPDH